MKHYKYLIMEINDNLTGFINDLIGGCKRGSKEDATETFFADIHDENTYWNSPSELLESFCYWMLPKGEQQYNQQNRVYSARAKYRFFRVEDTLCGSQLDEANINLPKYEITEDQFIYDMLTSATMDLVSEYLCADTPQKVYRKPQESTEVNIFISPSGTWDYTSSYRYLSNHDTSDHEKAIVVIPLELDIDKLESYISSQVDLPYKFVG